MPEIGAYEAKTHLPRLLERVRNGERFVITKHGQAVAELVPVTDRDSAGIHDAIESLASLRKKLHRRGVQLHDLLDEGETIRELAHHEHH